jgi:beta-phosphoglucomutase
MIRGVIFDLDGVLVSTDLLHYRAWEKLAADYGIPFDPQTGDRFRGVGRMECLDMLLAGAERSFSPSDKEAMAEQKNAHYRSMLDGLTPRDVLPGVADLLHALRSLKIKLAVGSSSRNASYLLQRVGLAAAFDAVVDGHAVQRTKPDPQVFLLAADRLGLKASECLVVEDAPAGVEAARRAGMACLAIGDRKRHPQAPYLASGLHEVSAKELLAQTGAMAGTCCQSRPDSGKKPSL